MLPTAEHATEETLHQVDGPGAGEEGFFKDRAHSVGISVSVCPVPLALTENHRTALGVSRSARKPDAQSAIWRSCHPALSPRIHAARYNHGRRMGGQSRAPLHATFEFGQDMIAKHRPVGFACGICGDDNRGVCCGALSLAVGGSSLQRLLGQAATGSQPGLLVSPHFPQRCMIARALGRAGKVGVTTAGPGGPARSV